MIHNKRRGVFVSQIKGLAVEEEVAAVTTKTMKMMMMMMMIIIIIIIIIITIIIIMLFVAILFIWGKEEGAYGMIREVEGVGEAVWGRVKGEVRLQ